MHISLTPELEACIKAKAESGLYNNASILIREAMINGTVCVRRGRGSTRRERGHLITYKSDLDNLLEQLKPR